MNNGFITLHRKMIKWEWYTDVNTCHLFIHMLLRANHEDNNWRGQVVKRGQFISGRKQLSIETGLTESQVRTSIAKLETTGEVASKTTNKNTTYTLVNYDFYQAKNTGSRQQDSQEVANKSPTNRQQDSQQIATNNNDKQYNNDNNMYIAPTDNQIEFAKSLGIDFAGLSKYELSKEIKKASSKSSSYVEPEYEEPKEKITSKIVFDEY